MDVEYVPKSGEFTDIGIRWAIWLYATYVLMANMTGEASERRALPNPVVLEGWASVLSALRMVRIELITDIASKARGK